MQLINWREDLPDELKLTTSGSNKRAVLPHILMMHCSFWWLVILLHRPFYRRRRASGVDNVFSVGVSSVFNPRFSETNEKYSTAMQPCCKGDSRSYSALA